MSSLNLSRPEKAFLIILGAWLLVGFLGMGIHLELAYWKAQQVLTFTFWLTPLPLLFLALRVRRKAWKVAAIACSSLLCLVALPPAACSALEVGSLPIWKDNEAFKPILRLSAQGTELVLYRTNCGAPCHYGLVLRQERTVVPGVRVTRYLANWYPADSGTVTLLSPSLIRVWIASQPYSGLPASTQDVPLRPSPFFPQ